MALFSKRFSRALADKSLGLSLPYRLRKRIWLTLVECDRSYFYQPDPDDNWTERTSVLAELPTKLKREYGEDELLGYTAGGEQRVPVNLEGLVLGGWPGQVLDTVELFLQGMDDDKRVDFQREVNRVFLEEGVPWRLADGEFFRVDSEFLALEVQRTEEHLRLQGFSGVLAELREARNDLSSGDYRGAIRSACNAFESAMKAVLGADSGTASELIRRMTEEGYFDDLPEDVRAGFGEQVLMALPFLGNRLGRHGQGREVVEVPREYAELAVGLAGQFINFCIHKALARREPMPAFVPNSLPAEPEESSGPVV